MKLTVLMENTAPEGLAREHGLSVYINYNNTPILLDGGSSGKFLENAKSLEVDITDIKLAALSHGHYDHGDGLAAFLRENTTAAVWLRPKALEEYWSDNGGERHFIGLSGEVKGLLEGRCRFVEGPVQLLPGAWLLPDQVDHEQSLVLEGVDGLVVFNSCCHAGAGYIVRGVKEVFPGKRVRALVGGLHLMGKNTHCLGVAPGIVKNLGKWLFEELEVGTLYTGHCTGGPAFELLQEAYPDRVERLTTGLTLEL